MTDGPSLRRGLRIGRSGEHWPVVLRGSSPAGDGTKGRAVYTGVHPPGTECGPRNLHTCEPSSVVIGSTHEDGHDVILLEESLKRGCPEHDVLPTGFIPWDFVTTKSIDAALREIGDEVARSWPRWPRREQELRAIEAKPAEAEAAPAPAATASDAPLPPVVPVA